MLAKLTGTAQETDAWAHGVDTDFQSIRQLGDFGRTTRLYKRRQDVLTQVHRRDDQAGRTKFVL